MEHRDNQARAGELQTPVDAEPVTIEPVEISEHDRITPPPSIYVASLADYNHGRLHGAWIDMTMDLSDIKHDLQRIMSSSPTLRSEGETFGDWAIHDYEHFGAARLSEHEDLDMLHKLAVGIWQHGEAFSAWADANDGEPDRWELFTEAFLGEYDSLRQFAEQSVDDYGWHRIIDRHMPGSVAQYLTIDYDRLARDMQAGGDIQAVPHNDKIWVFNANV